MTVSSGSPASMRQLARRVSARSLGSAPTDPPAQAASCLQSVIARQVCGDSGTTSTCTSSIRATVAGVSSKTPERPCPPRRSRSALLARRALRTRWASSTTSASLSMSAATTHAAGRRRTSVSRVVTAKLGTSDSFTIAEIVGRETFGASLQRARRHGAVFPESRGQQRRAVDVFCVGAWKQCWHIRCTCLRVQPKDGAVRVRLVLRRWHVNNILFTRCNGHSCRVLTSKCSSRRRHGHNRSHRDSGRWAPRPSRRRFGGPVVGTTSELLLNQPPASSAKRQADSAPMKKVRAWCALTSLNQGCYCGGCLPNFLLQWLHACLF